MKRIGFLFEKAFTIENLYEGFLQAKKSKQKKKDCYDFENNLTEELFSLYDELHNGTYHPRGYKTFTVKEPKERVIHAPAFRDTVVQHAIYTIIYPIYNKTFIDHSYACRKNKGTHKASYYTQKCLRNSEDNSYTLKLDIRKFFYNINRNILKKLLELKIKDKRFINILMMFTEMITKLGIPIGNLLSQIYSLIYLNPLDHFIKRILKVKKYVRYVDDFILIGLTRDECLYYKKLIILFLKEKLQLKLSKSTIQKVKKGLNFVGYRIWKTKKFIRKFSLYKFRKLVKQNKQESVVSILGHAKFTNSLFYLFKIIGEFNNVIKIPKSYRPVYNIYIKRARLS